MVEASAGTSAELGAGILLLSLRPLTYRGHLDERRAELRQRCLEIASRLASAHASELEGALAGAVVSINEFFHTAGVRFSAPRAGHVDAGAEVAWPADSEFDANGDAVLAQAAERLSWALRASDVLGRFGGDEFVAACPFMEEADAIAVVERLETALREPIEVEGECITVGVSVGSATAPRGAAADSLIAAAAEAMYRVKAARKAH